MRADIAERLRPVVQAADRSSRNNDDTASFPVDVLNAMRRTGMLGLLVGREYGGLGGNLKDLVDATVSLSRVDMSAGIILAMHCQQALTLQRYGTPSLLGSVLPEIASGRLYLGSVTTGSTTGGHLLKTDSTAMHTGDGFVIDRLAPIVTGGLRAEAFLITIGSPDVEDATDLLFARRAELDIEVLGGWDPVGMRATESIPLRLRGKVARENLIGGPAGFARIVAECFGPIAHLGWSAAWLGAAAGALSRVVTEGRRNASYRIDTNSDHQMMELGRVRGRLEAVNASLQHAVTLAGGTSEAIHSPNTQLALNRLKTFASIECFEVVDDLISMVGLKRGYTTNSELNLEQTWRDLRSASLNYSNDRLERTNGFLALRDTNVRFA